MPGRSTFIRDLSDKQRAEQRIEELRSGLIHAARVSAMGTMASTLAHELNQPITAVVNYVRFSHPAKLLPFGPEKMGLDI